MGEGKELTMLTIIGNEDNGEAKVMVVGSIIIVGNIIEDKSMVVGRPQVMVQIETASNEKLRGRLPRGI